jgi:hypothetical protein
VVTTVAEQPFTVAKIPVSSWTFAIRVWLAMVLALFVSFWLQLEAPASAALTVGILAEPTRGQALDKAGFRLLGTIVGVAASIAITGLFSQERDLASRTGEFHPRALLDTYVNLSVHTAPDVRPLPYSRHQWAKRRGFSRITRASQSRALFGRLCKR